MKYPVALATLIFATATAADVPYSPTVEGELPAAVIPIHEWNGFSQRIRETADAFAAEG